MSEDVKLAEAFKEVDTKLEAAFAKYEGEVQEAGKAAIATREEVKALTAAHTQMTEELKARLQEVEQKNVGGYGEKAQPSSWSDSFMEGADLAALASGRIKSHSVSVKNTIIGEGGSPQNPIDTLTQADRMSGIVPGAFRPLNILDVVPTGRTVSNAIEYTRELAYTNAAAEKAEGAAKPESTLTFELVSDSVRTIPHFLKASKQVLDDAPMLRSYIDGRLSHGVRNRLQTQILGGNGTSPNIAGLSASGRHTAFTPTTGDTGLDSLNKAKYLVIAADYEANFIFMNPADWGVIERTKTTTSGYVAGDGAGLSYIQGGMTPTVWGLPVILSNSVASGKFYMGDSAAMMLFVREDVNVNVGYENDDFTKNLVTILAEMRGALAVFTPAAIQYGDLTV
jgi:HK97 family phage major capsid protein